MKDIVNDDEISMEGWVENDCVRCGDLQNKNNKNEYWLSCGYCLSLRSTRLCVKFFMNMLL